MKTKFIYFLFILNIVFSSCESEQEKKARLQREEQQRIECKLQLEKDRKEKEIYERYINNSLSNGSTPYSNCYGENRNCSEYGCSQITVKTPYNSDVLVTIKSNNDVVRHAFITAGSTYTFEVSNGTYQPFFYYGKGWHPDKFMKNASCGEIRGGFISDESFGKDNPQILDNNILSYELILQQNGNFSTQPSNQNDAL